MGLTEALLGLTLLLSLISASFAATLARKNSRAWFRKELAELSDRIDALEAQFERRWQQVKIARATANVQRGRERQQEDVQDRLELDDAQRRGPLAMLNYNMRKNGLG